MKMPWGAHRGTPIEFVPKHYLRWLAKKTDLEPRLLAEIHKNLSHDVPPSIPSSPEQMHGVLLRLLDEAKLRHQYSDLGALRAVYWAYRRLRALLGMATEQERREDN